jgi:AraC-like DNA-binding protein
MTTLKIKNMVCDRCIMTVEAVLEDLGFDVREVSLGNAVIFGDPERDEFDQISEELSEKGFELITDRNDKLLEELKVQLLSYLRYLEDTDDPQKLSTYLQQELNYNYSYLSNYFSKHMGMSIKKYLINLKIERVKELLTYGELTLSEIAWKLNYSSVQYLSNQFKNVTGETVSSFRSHSDKNSRQSLDAV